MARLMLSLIGPMQVHLDGNPIEEFGYDKVRALLAYLAVESGRAHQRDSLVGLLWPEFLQSSARHNLSQALFRLRRTIDDQSASPPFLVITRSTIRFNPASEHWLDVKVFDQVTQGNCI